MSRRRRTGGNPPHTTCLAPADRAARCRLHGSPQLSSVASPRSGSAHSQPGKSGTAEGSRVAGGGCRSPGDGLLAATHQGSDLAPRAPGIPPPSVTVSPAEEPLSWPRLPASPALEAACGFPVLGRVRHHHGVCVCLPRPRAFSAVGDLPWLQVPPAPAAGAHRALGSPCRCFCAVRRARGAFSGCGRRVPASWPWAAYLVPASASLSCRLAPPRSLRSCVRRSDPGKLAMS